MSGFVIAIDGPAGSGKSTVAKLTAAKLGFLYVDTGAMYRALTFKALRENIPLEDEKKLIEMTEKTSIELCSEHGKYRVFLDGRDVSENIRTEEISSGTQFTASILPIREILWKMQREYRKRNNIVMEGRDIGSKVFPDAELKIFLDADTEERARRRLLQMRESGVCYEGGMDEIEKDIRARDEKDRQRNISPLVRLPDAVYIDTTGMTISEVTDKITGLYKLRS